MRKIDNDIPDVNEFYVLLYRELQKEGCRNPHIAAFDSASVYRANMIQMKKNGDIKDFADFTTII